MADMDRHRIIRTIRLLLPYLLVDLVDGKYFAFVLYKEEKDVVLDPESA